MVAQPAAPIQDPCICNNNNNNNIPVCSSSSSGNNYNSSNNYNCSNSGSNRCKSNKKIPVSTTTAAAVATSNSNQQEATSNSHSHSNTRSAGGGTAGNRAHNIGGSSACACGGEVRRLGGGVFLGEAKIRPKDTPATAYWQTSHSSPSWLPLDTPARPADLGCSQKISWQVICRFPFEFTYHISPGGLGCLWLKNLSRCGEKCCPRANVSGYGDWGIKNKKRVSFLPPVN